MLSDSPPSVSLESSSHPAMEGEGQGAGPTSSARASLERGVCVFTMVYIFLSRGVCVCLQWCIYSSVEVCVCVYNGVYIPQ